MPTATLVKVLPVSAAPLGSIGGGATAGGGSATLDGKFAANVTLPDGSVIQVKRQTLLELFELFLCGCRQEWMDPNPPIHSEWYIRDRI